LTSIVEKKWWKKRVDGTIQVWDKMETKQGMDKVGTQFGNPKR